jgi:hypothetical protein
MFAFLSNESISFEHLSMSGADFQSGDSFNFGSMFAAVDASTAGADLGSPSGESFSTANTGGLENRGRNSIRCC